MLVLMLQHVSSRVSGFPAASPCLWGKLQNPSFLKVSRQVVMSFCVAGVALPDVYTCLQPCRQIILCGRRNSFAWILEDDLQFWWQAQHFVDFHHQFAWHAQHFRCVVFRDFSRITLSGLRQVVTLNTLHSTLCTSHFTLYTPHFTLYTPQSTLYTLHSTLYTLHSTLYTLHSKLYTSHFTLYTTLYTPHFTLYTPHSTLYTPHFTLHTLHFILSAPHSKLYTLHSTLYTLHFTL